MTDTERTIVLVACAGKKLPHAARAKDLYASSLFEKSRAYAEDRAAAWFILSALHGLVEPDAVIEPYDVTLNDMSAAARRAWSRRVIEQLDRHVHHGDTVVILAGARYRDGIVPELRSRGVKVEVPLEGLRIGEQLAYLGRDEHELPSGSGDAGALRAFYEVLHGLAERGGTEPLPEVIARRDLPERGVYFFLDPCERRRSSPGSARVVRVGTHALKRDAVSTLRGRLKQHFGRHDGGGNHRGSVFRLHVGMALHERDGGGPASWAVADVAASVRAAERSWERRVSAYIRGLDVITLGVLDESGPGSHRAYVERNAIALLSTLGRHLDPPTEAWLGQSSPREAIRTSGLWNVNHVGESVDGEFLERFAETADGVGGRRSRAGATFDRPRVRSSQARGAQQAAGPETGSSAAQTRRARAAEFRAALSTLLSDAERTRQAYVDVRSGELHRVVGGYPGRLHALSTCCSVMRSVMRDGDREVEAPPKGVGASLVIRYRLPR